MKVLEQIIARTVCAMHYGIFSLYYIFKNDACFLDFRAQKFPLIFFNLNPFLHQQALHFGVLNYENQYKEGTCKVSGRWVIFSAFYADFCLCPKSVIITTLIERQWSAINTITTNVLPSVPKGKDGHTQNLTNAHE